MIDSPNTVLMFHQLKAIQFENAAPLFKAMDYNLAPQAILAGAVPGKIYVDNPSEPTSAVVQAKRRFYLAGAAHNEQFNEGLKRFFGSEQQLQTIKAGQADIVLYYSSDSWESTIEEVLVGNNPMRLERQAYAFKELHNDWRAMVPTEFSVHPVDNELLSHEHLQNRDRLVEEILSEGPSVAYWLENCFGFSMMTGNKLTGWCLSEHNCETRCEVGIETVQEYRQRGIATVLVSALVEHALARGVTEIGWHSYVSNTRSIATARKVGFEKVQDYSVYYVKLKA